ncbi:hypothetical protein GA0070616_3751 [Micromonospora nigra]|uniref:PH domain-containing protein n=1 Tax=Micromonospora nigra TaxID=145857 RepID=A0A1C6SGX3_9ACTN|nr:hypothetical protein [Micromonospora nigra]SCL28734.1 hypothetical protein GA0070616_3751 [Micromonospora nigra]
MVRGPKSPTRVGGGVGELVVMWAGFPLLGAGAGWLLALATNRAAALSWLPLWGPFRLLAEAPEPQSTIGATVVGVLVGLLVALVGTRDRLVVTVGPAGVDLRRQGLRWHVDRGRLRAVFRDGPDLVLVGDGGRELFREPSDLSTRRLRAAFQAHDHPWAEQDPHRDEFRRWVEQLPGLPPGADALLRARQRAVERDRHGEARELRDELGRLGVVVRDARRRQYWRLVPPPDDPPAGEP